MLKTLHKIARTGIVTEAPPPADEHMRVREALEHRIREVLGRALCIRQVDAMAASSRSTRSTTSIMTSSASA